MTNAALKATVAAIAITAGSSVWAQTDADISGETNADVTTQTQTQETLDSTGEALSNIADSAGDAITDAGEAVADTADEAVDTTAQAMDDATSDTAVDGSASVTSGADVQPEMANGFSRMVAGDIVGQTVVEASGQDVGEVDYVIDNGDEMAVVIGVGGFLGLGAHDVAIPLSEINQGGEGNLMLRSMTRADLEAMPEVDAATVTEVSTDQPLRQGS